MRLEQLHFALNGRRRNRHIEVWSSHVAIPFWDLVLKNEMISKRIPSEASDLAMVLMRVVTAVGEDHIGIDAAFQAFKPGFDLLALLGEEAVSKSHDLDVAARSFQQKLGSRCSGFLFAFTGSTEHAPMDVKLNAIVLPAQKCRSRTNLDVI